MKPAHVTRLAPQASRQLLEEEFPVESVVLDELQTQTVEQASFYSELESAQALGRFDLISPRRSLCII